MDPKYEERRNNIIKINRALTSEVCFNVGKKTLGFIRFVLDATQKAVAAFQKGKEDDQDLYILTYQVRVQDILKHRGSDELLTACGWSESRAYCGGLWRPAYVFMRLAEGEAALELLPEKIAEVQNAPKSAAERAQKEREKATEQQKRIRELINADRQERFDKYGDRFKVANSAEPVAHKAGAVVRNAPARERPANALVANKWLERFGQEPVYEVKPNEHPLVQRYANVGDDMPHSGGTTLPQVGNSPSKDYADSEDSEDSD